MIERLEATLEKYNHLQEELTKPEILSDHKKTKEYSQEISELEEIVTCYKKYKKVCRQLPTHFFSIVLCKFLFAWSDSA